MANSQVITVTLKAITDLSDIRSNAKQLQQAFAGLKLPPSTQKQFTDLYNNIIKNSDKAAAAMANGFKNKGDVTKYQNAMNAITLSMQKMSQLAHGIDLSKLNFEVNPEKARALIEEIETLQKKLDTLNADNLKKITDVANKPPSQASAWKTFLQQFESRDYEGAARALDDLQKKLAKAQAPGGSAEKNPEYWKRYAEGVQIYEQALNSIISENGELKTTQEQYNSALQRQAQLQVDANTEGNQALQRTVALTDEATTSTQNYTKSQIEAAQAESQLNSELDQFKSRISYFFGMNNAVNLLRRALTSALDTVKDLDKVMTETAVVTDFNIGDMWAQLPEYTKRANELGVSIHSAYEAMTIFYQQGLNTNQAVALSNETLKMARIAGLDAADASDRMTNALRGFNMVLDETNAQRVDDVYNRLAAISASNVDEISTAMTKVASLAHSANMEFETTSAFLAQMIETTRESAETAGTALKTVVARFSEVKKLYSEGQLMGSDEEGESIDVNKVGAALRSAGINLNEYLTGAKGLDQIFLELASKWDSLDLVTQRYIATMAAGSRQQSRFIAMMSDYKRTVELVDAANNASGSANKMFEKTLESLETKLARLKNAWDEYVMGIADSSVIKFVVDALTGLIGAVNGLTKDMTGLGKSIVNILIAFGTLKAGAAIFKNILANWGAIARGEGVKTGAKFGQGFASAISKLKAFSIKDALFANPLKTKTQIDAIKTSLVQVTNAQNAYNIASALGKDNPNYYRAVNEALIARKAILDSVNLSQEQLMAIEGLGLTVDQQAVLLSNEKTAAQAAEILSDKLLSDEEKKLALAKLAEVDMSKRGLITLLAEGAYRITNVLGMKLETSWIYKKIFARKVENGVLTETIALEYAALAVVGLILAAVAALIIIVIAIYKAVQKNSLANRMKEAAAATKEAKEQADAAKQSYDDLLESRSKYDSLQNSLDLVSESTENWNKQLLESNQSVLELIQKFPQLADGLTNVNGRLMISSSAWDNLEKSLQNSQIITMAQVFTTELKNIDLEQESLNLERARSINAKYEELNMRAISQAISGDIRSTSAIDQITGQEDLELKQLQQEYQEFVKAEDEKLQRNQQSLSLKRKTLATTQAIQVLGPDIDGKLFSDYFLTSHNTSQFKDDLKDANTDIRRYLLNLGIESIGTKEELQKAYSALYGIPVDEISDDIKNDSNKLSEKITEAYATIDFKNKAEDIYANLSNQFASAEAFNEFKAGIEGNFATYAKAQGFDIDEAIANIEMAAGGATEVDWAMWGAKNKDEYKKHLEEQQKEAIHIYETGIEKLSIVSSKSAYTDLSSNTINGLMTQVATLGEDQAKEYLENFINGLNGLPQEVQEIAAQTDLSSIGNINSAILQMGQLGISTDKLSTYWTKVIENTGVYVKNLHEALSISDSLIAQADNESEMRQRLLEGKGTIEDIEKLVQAGADVSSFERTTDGWKATGSAIDFALDKLNQYLVLSAKVDKQATINKYNKVEGTLFGGNTGVTKDAFLTLDFDNLRAAESADWADRLIKAGFLEEEDKFNDAARQAGLQAAQEFVQGYEGELHIANQTIDYLQNATGKSKISEAGLDPDAVTAYTNRIKKENEDINDEDARNQAIRFLRQDNALKTLIKDYETWQKVVHDGKINIKNEEDAKSFNELKKNVKDFLGLSVPLSDSFFADSENQSLLKSALQGNIEDYAALLKKAQIDVLEHLKEEGTDVQSFINWVNELPAGIIEISSEFDNTELLTGFQAALEAGRITADRMQQIFDDMGWEVEFEEIWVPDLTPTQVFIKPGDTAGKPIGAYTDTSTKVSSGRMVSVPKIKSLKKKTSENPLQNVDRYQSESSSGGSGGSGSSGSSESPKPSSNPFEYYYNETQRINAALRERERLERQYQKLLKNTDTTSGEILANYRDQVAQLEKARDTQDFLAKEYRRLLNTAGGQIYTDEEGNRQTYASTGATNYVRWDDATNTIKVDFWAVDNLARNPANNALIAAIESYKSYLEDNKDKMEEAEDQRNEMQDSIDEMPEQIKENLITLGDRIRDAIVTQREKQIDDYEKLSSLISDSNSKVIEELQESIELSRQIRDNTKTEADIADKEQRLAYLMRDTSGANDTEIKKLQKEIEEARQSYQDTLIDQSIDDLSKKNDKATEQREQQIELLRAQLEVEKENGAIWEAVNQYIAASWDSQGHIVENSPLFDLLKESESFKSLSAPAQEKWLQELRELINQFYLRGKAGVTHFATGGLASFTGPAWLDGTSSHPELVLNAADTENFIQLKEILSGLLGGQSINSSVSSGDNYFDISIQAELGSDYDVDQLATRIKQQIAEDAMYRNVNMIDYLH